VANFGFHKMRGISRPIGKISAFQKEFMALRVVTFICLRLWFVHLSVFFVIVPKQSEVGIKKIKTRLGFLSVYFFLLALNV
jgi:hypothetical protein